MPSRRTLVDVKAVLVEITEIEAAGSDLRHVSCGGGACSRAGRDGQRRRSLGMRGGKIGGIVVRNGLALAQQRGVDL
jgi:hypothetical protein